VWSYLSKEIVRRAKSFIRDRVDDGWRASNVFCGIIVPTLLISILALTWQKFNQTSKLDHEGTIVDRWANYSESNEG